jgi:hypothetical protein
MTMIALQNGSRIVQLDITANTQEGSGTPVGFHGFALAQTPHGEYVTWRVTATTNEKLDAHSGTYHGSNYAHALRDFNQRRRVTMEGV